MFLFMVAQYAESAPLTAELEQLEQTVQLDPELLHAGIFARAYIAFFLGELSTALRLLEQLTPAEHAPSIFRDNPVGRAVALGHLACALWAVGEPERAFDAALATIQLALAIQVPVVLALGHVVRARLRFLRRDPLASFAHEIDEAVSAASVDVGLHTEARVFALWASALAGPLELSAIAPLLDGLYQRLTEVSTCSTLVGLMLIDTLRRSGHATDARKLTDEMIAFGRAHNERVYLPELLRVRGEQREAEDPAAAGGDYHEAIALARALGARSSELQVLAALADLAT
jgi:hypothetical protein